MIGSGTIGIMTALAAAAGGCSEVFIVDLVQEKLNVAAKYPSLTPINLKQEDAVARVFKATGGWGADIVFEASGALKAYETLFDFACPGGAVVLVGMPPKPVAYDVVAAEAKELRVEHVFRYANIYDRAISLLGSGKIDVKPLISKYYPFDKSVEAFEFAAQAQPHVIKTQIVFD